MNNDEQTAALRDLITAELASEQSNGDPAAVQARIVAAQVAYDLTLTPDTGAWDQALDADGGAPRPRPSRTTRPSPVSAADRRRRITDKWQQALRR